MQDDIQNDNLVNDKVVNDKALDLLDEAMFTSSLISDRKREQGRVDTWDNVYPTTREETDRMEQLLDEAERVADAPNEDDYSQRLHDLRKVEDWSKQKHRSWTWSLILGAER